MTTVNHERISRPVGRAESVGVAPALHLVASVAQPDLGEAEVAAAAFLEALGLRLDSEHLRATPGRMARAWAEMLTPRPFELTTFPNDEGYDELVLARNIPFRSVCEHHLLPFAGRACVGYLPGDRILGLSKLARVVEHFACRPQTQERLTKQVADWLQEQLAPRAVGVVLSAEHSCMTLRGVQASGAMTVTSTLLGRLRSDLRSRQEFLSLSGAMP
ncbi:MAG TPA: GTP cyclohydrolase I [Segeticoccus sp.]|uniref:GTP cyclohydrolase I n=1 Tax=Segeticoccus sp. TaxID=2706531 RepID=UPI002D807336|nr:GTP cyclohydrolase I [Segeticoccus sp.]HET8599022.1 GTP cyclohydrolase I [Segeticoccus sp.]